MNTTGRRLLALMALLSGTVTASANDLLRLYEMALTTDAALQGASAQRDAAIEARPQARAQLLPQVAAGGSATRDDSSSYELTLSQTLWNFESFSRVRQANRLASSAEAQLTGAQQSLLLRTADAYFGILAARDQLATALSEREAFRVLLEQARNREQTGVGPRSAVDQVQAYYDATEARVINSENGLDDARLVMAQIVGERIDDVAILRDDIPLASPEPASIDEWVLAARIQNPSVRAAALSVEAADFETAAELGKNLPTVSLTSSSSRAWQETLPGGNQSLDTIGLQFSLPLFQGGAGASRLRQSRALYHQAQADHETAIRDAESRTRAAYRGVVTGIQRIAAARRAVESARAAVEASRRNVEFGTGTEFDLLTAQNNYSIAQLVFSQSRYDYLRNGLELKRQAGRLMKQDLVAIDELLVQP